MRNLEITSRHYRIKNTKTFSEHDIMQLQDVFLTHGFHSITVKSVDEGRVLIAKFMHALNYYKNIACLSCLPMHSELDNKVFNIYKVLHVYEDITEQVLFDFFLEYFCADFLVIEMSKKLMRMPWFDQFQQQLIDFKIDMAIPIICLSYPQSK